MLTQPKLTFMCFHQGAEFTFNPKPLGMRTTRGHKQLSTITERNSNDNDKKMCLTKQQKNTTHAASTTLPQNNNAKGECPVATKLVASCSTITSKNMVKHRTRMTCFFTLTQDCFSWSGIPNAVGSTLQYSKEPDFVIEYGGRLDAVSHTN